MIHFYTYGDENEAASRHFGETRPAIVVRTWPNEYGAEGGYNILVFADGANDEAATNILWRTSVKMTEYATPGCLSRSDQPPPDVHEAGGWRKVRSDLAKMMVKNTLDPALAESEPASPAATPAAEPEATPESALSPGGSRRGTSRKGG